MKRKNVGKVLILVMILGMFWYTGTVIVLTRKLRVYTVLMTM